VLDGLDSVDWTAIGHAYGPASDVPGLLRSLASPDDQERKEALYDLYGNIWHQGTVYEATAYAVPFLLQLAANPRVPDRAELVGFLAALANGMANARSDADRARQAVSKGRQLFLDLLVGPDRLLRAAAAHVIARVPEMDCHGAICSALGQEQDSLARAGMLIALGESNTDTHGVRAALQAALTCTAERERLAAAISLVRIYGRDAGTTALKLVDDADPIEASRLFTVLPWDTRIDSELESLQDNLEA
jgi:hypothetical protein